MSTGHLRVADDDGVRTITIDRPESKNALTTATRAELCQLLADADDDEAVRVVILAAVDPVFTAGVDFKDVSSPVVSTLNPGQALRAMRTPVICAVNGACVSGGLELALSCTFVIASERARFADTHARLGVVPAWGLTALLPRAIGVRKARELSITGNFVDAAEALRIGLVNHVVPHEELASFTRTLAAQIADTDAVGDVLSLYRRGEDLSLADAIDLEAAHVPSRPFDPAAFAERGRAAAARQREA